MAIVITNVVAPEQGWPIAAHCSKCKRTEIILSLSALKPERGDFWLLEGICLDESEYSVHNMPKYPEVGLERFGFWQATCACPPAHAQTAPAPPKSEPLG